MESVKKYRKKPVVIEAIRWDDNNETLKNIYAMGCDAEFHPTHALLIRTLEGIIKCEIGDWIIKGIKGEFYSIKNDIFLETYKEVTDGK